MDNSIPIEKIFEMYGRVSLERDLMREELISQQEGAKRPEGVKDDGKQD